MRINWHLIRMLTLIAAVAAFWAAVLCVVL